MMVEDLIYKNFRDERTIWKDYIDYVKVNNRVQRKGLSYVKKWGVFEIYLESEEGEQILFDVLKNEDVSQFECILKAFKQ